MKKFVLFCMVFPFIGLDAKEIVSAEGDGIVRHRDMILQNAKPGDYLYRNKGKTKKTLVQEDIDYSKKEYNKILKSLLDERPGSIRAIIKEIVEDIGIEMPYPESEAEDVNIHYLNELSGKGVIEYVSSINKRKQIITVMVRESQNLSYFTKKYKTPPWSSKVLSEGTPSIVIFAKKVNSNQNICMSFNENIEETKRHLNEVKIKASLAMGTIRAYQEYGYPIYISWDKNENADKYMVLIKDNRHKLVDSFTRTTTYFSYYQSDDFKYPAYISVIAMKDNISGEPSDEARVDKPSKPKKEIHLPDIDVGFTGSLGISLGIYNKFFSETLSISLGVPLQCGIDLSFSGMHLDFMGELGAVWREDVENIDIFEFNYGGAVEFYPFEKSFGIGFAYGGIAYSDFEPVDFNYTSYMRLSLIFIVKEMCKITIFGIMNGDKKFGGGVQYGFAW